MTFIIKTERLLLREVQNIDLDGFFELDTNPIVHRYLGNRLIKTKEEAKAIINKIQNQYKERGIGRWAAIEKKSGQFIGWSGLKLNNEETWNKTTHFYDIGYRLIPRFWNKGYATESAKAILHYGFKTMKLPRIIGMADVNNIASNKILKKIGLLYINEFIYEKQTVVWYELKKEDYEKNMSRM